MSGLCIHCGGRLDDGERRPGTARTATGALCTRCDAAFWGIVHPETCAPGAPTANRRAVALVWLVAGLLAAALTCVGLYLLLTDVVGTTITRAS